jgi:hypothetical protein
MEAAFWIDPFERTRGGLKHGDTQETSQTRAQNKIPAREKAVSASFVRELLDDLEKADQALMTAKIMPKTRMI